MNPLLNLQYIVIFGVLLLLCGGWLCWKSTAGASVRLRATLLVLRCAALAGLLLLFLNLGHLRKDSEAHNKYWAILLDRSESMSVADEGSMSRWAKALTATEKQLIPAATDKHLTFYTFSDKIEESDDSIALLAKRRPDGGHTDIFRSCRELIDRVRGKDDILQGIILLSDGRQIVSGNRQKLVLAALSENIPLHCLALGSAGIPCDLSVVLPHRQFLAFVGQKIKVPVKVVNQGMGKRKVKVILRDTQGKECNPVAVMLENDTTAGCEFQLEFKAPGYYNYRVEVPDSTGETDRRNNCETFGVNVLPGNLKVLMLEGMPFWDSKFLSQLLRQEKSISLTTIYRVADGQYFSIRTDSGETISETASLLPDTARVLSQYDLIIIGKGAEYFFDEARTKALRSYLSDYGGAVLFARGIPYEGEFPRLAELEPVDWGADIEGEFSWRPAPVGISSGLFGDMLPDPGDNIWQKLPRLNKAVHVQRLKTFTETLLYADNALSPRSRPVPVLLSRKFGRGQVMTVNAEGLWQWGFFPSVPESEELYNNFFLQLINWIVRSGDFLPGMNYALHLDRTVTEPETPVMISSSCRDAAKTASIKIELMHADKVVYSYSLAAGNDTLGGHNEVVYLKEPGSYLIKLTGTDKSGHRETIYSSLYIKEPPAEMSDSGADRELMKQLAEATGGFYLNDRAEAFSEIFNQTRGEEADAELRYHWQSSWDVWYFLLPLLFILSLEIYLRRRNGLL